jgi:hypothetical protein
VPDEAVLNAVEGGVNHESQYQTAALHFYFSLSCSPQHCSPSPTAGLTSGSPSESLSVVPYEFDRQNYGFALEDGIPLVGPVNQALLTVRKSPEWRKEVLNYLGE